MAALSANALALEYYRKALLEYDSQRELEKDSVTADSLKTIAALTESSDKDVVMNDQPVEIAKIDYLVNFKSVADSDEAGMAAALASSGQRETVSMYVNPLSRRNIHSTKVFLNKLRNPGQESEIQRVVSAVLAQKIELDFKNAVTRFITQAHQFNLTDEAGTVIVANNFKHFNDKAFFSTEHSFKVISSDQATVSSVNFSNLIGYDAQATDRKPMLAVAANAKILRYFYHPISAISPTELNSSTISSPVVFSNDLAMVFTQDTVDQVVSEVAKLACVYKSTYKPIAEEKCVRSDKAVTAENIQELFDALYGLPVANTGKMSKQEVGYLFVHQSNIDEIRAMIRNVDVQKPNSIEFKLEKLMAEGKILTYV